MTFYHQALDLVRNHGEATILRPSARELQDHVDVARIMEGAKPVRLGQLDGIIYEHQLDPVRSIEQVK